MSKYKNVAIYKAWAMPNAETFTIIPIKKFIESKVSSLPKGSVIVDPYARNKPLADLFSDHTYITNDLDTNCPTDYHLDATEFLATLADESVDFMLFDAPYSPRQLS